MAKVKHAIHIRQALPHDWAAIDACFSAAGRMAWKDFMPTDVLAKIEAPERWRLAITALNSDVQVLVAESEDRVVGFSVLGPMTGDHAMPQAAEIAALYTMPHLWGHGFGRKLMKESLAWLKSRGYLLAMLWTEERNIRPRRFYELGGWRKPGPKRERQILGVDLTELMYVIDL